MFGFGGWSLGVCVYVCGCSCVCVSVCLGLVCGSLGVCMCVCGCRCVDVCVWCLTRWCSVDPRVLGCVLVCECVCMCVSVCECLCVCECVFVVPHTMVPCRPSCVGVGGASSLSDCTATVTIVGVGYKRNVQVRRGQLTV